MSHKSIYYFCLLLITLYVLSPSACTAEEEKKTVLYLNSYHNGYHWSDGLLKGVRTVLNSSRYKIDLQIEYMDAKKYNYANISKNLFSLYKEKFVNENFDIIIISDNDALNFINEHRDELFPGVPVVFCGINDLQKSDTIRGNITGVVEIFDLIATLEVAKTLHPEKNRLVVLIDNSTAGRAIQRQVEKIAKREDTGLEIEFWVQLSMQEAQQRVRKLPDNTFLFIAPYYQTIEGHFYTSEEVSEAIYKHSSVPIYTAWEFMVGYGAVGGRVLSGVKHGEIAGRMALEILAGVKPDDIPINNKPGGVYIFDYAVMDKLGIDQMLLPENRKIINSPEAFYSLSKELFWTIMISFVLLLLALVSMLGAMLERRKAELKIIDQLAFQETLMDTIPQLVSWKDVNGKYLGANQAFVDFFGIAETQLVEGMNTYDIVRDDDYGNWSAVIDSAVIDSQKAFRKLRRQVSSQDGNESWLEVNKVPLKGQGGRLVGVLSTAENITKEQNLEKQLLQSQKMEAIGTLAGGISHDFNNILTSIINSTELAIGDIPPESQTEADLKRVLKAARRGSRVVQQILSFSRPSTEGFRPTDMSEIIQEVVHLMEASTPANINVSCMIQERCKFFVHADPTQMHQAILNLTTNGYHALREKGGNLEIFLKREHDTSSDIITTEHGENYQIKVSVADNGPGIAPEIIDKIFNPFFSTKAKGEGTGLGLAVVHGIVKSHQGSISVAHREGGGTIFEIILPESEAANDIVSNSLHGDIKSGGNILFVEDDEDQLQTTPRLLEEMGFSVTAVRDSLAAVKLASSGQNHFDIVISDFDMPELSGTELAEQLTELPFILISGRDDAKTAARPHANIQKVIIKPYHKKDIMDGIRDIRKNLPQDA
ncbi:MAG: response regulator [Desulfobulbaceae bacterium]|nr:response regulator [Desulfobulbaceae bacterium]